MRSGVSTFSYTATATYALVTGDADANYPIGNLADLFQISNPARITPDAGEIAFTAVLTTDQTVQMAALVQHRLPAGATVRTRLFSDAGMTTTVTGGDLGPTAIPAPVTGYRQTFPAVMAASRTVRAVRIDIEDAGSDPIDFGGLEIAQWWELPKITATAEIGFGDGADDIALLGGGAWGRQEYRPNTYSGQVAHMDTAVSLTTGLDFQKYKQLSRPFVFCEDYSDPASWPRTTFLAMNSDLSPFVAALYSRDRYQFRLAEHVR